MAEYLFRDNLGELWKFDTKQYRIYLVAAENTPENGYPCISVKDAVMQLMEGGYVTEDADRRTRDEVVAACYRINERIQELNKKLEALDPANNLYYTNLSSLLSQYAALEGKLAGIRWMDGEDTLGV